MEYIERVQSATSVDEVLASATRFAILMGFEYCSYVHRPNTYFSINQTIYSNYPESWQSIYLEENYVNIDPTVRHAIKSTTPLTWTVSNSFDEVPKFREGMAAFDFKFGWCQSTRSTAGMSMLSLARSDSYIPHTEINTPSLMWFTQVFNSALEKLITKSSLREDDIHLTSREIDVMRWTADGKTSHEISVILSISERTVNFHLNNVINKLGANNRIYATVKAISLGLI
jgi:DNA-binding CsgD family transcriptional regulator